MPDPSETIRAIFRVLPGGGLRLRRAPTVKIDQRVLLQVFGPARDMARLLKNNEPEKAAPAKPSTGRQILRVVLRTPKKS